jgi:hypothetical protein
MKPSAPTAEAQEQRSTLIPAATVLRQALWLLFFALTAALMTYPTHLRLRYEAVQSLSGLEHVPLFAGLYLSWLLLLVVLLLSDGKSRLWKKAVLVGLFALVFLGFWLLAEPNTALRYDGVGNAAYVQYLFRYPGAGLSVDHPNLSYFNFPGMHLFALAVVEATGLEVVQSVAAALAAHLLLVSLLVYLLLLRVLGHSTWAALGALLTIQGNIMLARYSFYPGFWALPFALVFLLLLLAHPPGRALFDTWAGRLLAVTVLGATTITHLVTGLLLFTVLAGVYVVRSWRKLGGGSRAVSVLGFTMATFLVIRLSWDVYWASHFLEQVTKVTEAVIDNILENGVTVYFYSFNRSASYIGERVPVWAVAVRSFWWVTVYGAGLLLGLARVVRVKSLGLSDELMAGGLLGVVGLSGLVTLLSPGGSEFYRFLFYGAFFTVPIALLHVVRLPASARRLALKVTVSLFFALSFPTFLAHNNLVGVSTYYLAELEAGRFLKETSGRNGSGLIVFNDPNENGVLFFSIPDASFVTTPQGSELRGKDDFWKAVNKHVHAFTVFDAGAANRNAVFYLSQRRITLAEHLFGAQPQDPEWKELQDNLAVTNKVYENGTVQAYGSSRPTP